MAKDKKFIDMLLNDPCCGSGGMFVQSVKFVEAHGGNTKAVMVYGQESQPETFRLAKMNLAVRGISHDPGKAPVSTFTNDQHPGKKMDYIMANPPFNLKKWRLENELTNDYRWQGYGTPPVSNANYAWILNRNKKGGVWHGRRQRNREDEILFVDLRTWNQNIYEKKYVQFSEQQTKNCTALKKAFEQLGY